MKILFILEYYHPHIGGVETLFKNLTEELSKKGHQVIVLTNRFDKTLKNFEQYGDIVVHRLPYNNRYLFTFLSIIPAVRLARKNDIIHTTSYNAAVPAYIASFLTNTKALITFHEVWGKLWFRLPWISHPSKVLHFLFEQIILRMSFHKFIAVSDFTKSALISHGITPHKIQRIYNGIEYTQFEEVKNQEKLSEKTFLYFGRIGVSKGIDILLKAVGLLKKETEAFKVKMVLPDKRDTLTTKVRSIITNENLGANITIQSSVSHPELQKLIKSVNAVIIPSYSEGFCFAAVETMALGTPLIVSGEGALKEVIGGKHLIFENLSHIDLKNKMMDALKEKWSEKPLKKFELHESVEEYTKVYSQLFSQ